MRSSLGRAALMIICVTALATACGQQQAGSAPGGQGTPSVPSSVSPGGRTPVLTLSAVDTGRSYRVRPGTGVLIYLKGTPANMWTRPRSDSPALAPRANGHLMLALGVTGAYFVAVHPGTATITATRHLCASQAPSPAALLASPSMSCGAIESFQVSVTVTS